MATSCSKFILIGRNLSKLDDVENELKSLRIDVVIEKRVIDFSTFEDYSGLRQGFLKILSGPDLYLDSRYARLWRDSWVKRVNTERGR